MKDAERALSLQLQFKRAIELLDGVIEESEKNPDREGKIYSFYDDSAELKAKMHEIRRDSKKLEKIIYPDYRGIIYK